MSDFFAGVASPGEVVITASDVDLSTVRTTSPIIGLETSDLDSLSNFVPVSRVSVGCKATGRPKPRISWSRMVRGGELETLNVTMDLDFNVTSARQGQSVLTVALEDGDVYCTRYICAADNGGMVAEGAVEVCPQCKDNGI